MRRAHSSWECAVYIVNGGKSVFGKHDKVKLKGPVAVAFVKFQWIFLELQQKTCDKHFL